MAAVREVLQRALHGAHLLDATLQVGGMLQRDALDVLAAAPAVVPQAEQGLDLRQENGIAKVYLANMVHKVVDTAIQLHGALGYSMDTPLARWYTQIRSQRLVDGADEVHRWTVGRNVIKAFQRDGTTAAAAGGDLL